MKKILKMLVFFLSLLLILSLFNDNVYAWYTPSNNYTALAVGAYYNSSVSSINNATDAYSTYNAMGLTTMKITSPTLSNLTGAHSNGVPYLQSGIIYFNGHATSFAMLFPDNVNIIANNIISGSNIGIGYYDNKKTAFIEFAGCQTAKGTDSIAEYANDQGANITMGWTTDLNISSFVNWNTRFNDKIQTKTTSVNDAAASASNHIYLNNTVKNYKVYGAGGYNPWYWITGKKTASSTGQVALKTNKYTIRSNVDNNYFKEDNINVINNLIYNYISKSVTNDFDAKNYRLEVNGNDVKYYDYVLYLDNVRTNLGYTVSINNDNEIYLFDNMQGIKEKDAINQVSTNMNKYTRISYDMLENISMSDSLSSVPNTNSEIVNRINYYDFDSNKAFYVLEIKNTASNGAMSLQQYQYEI